MVRLSLGLATLMALSTAVTMVSADQPVFKMPAEADAPKKDSPELEEFKPTTIKAPFLEQFANNWSDRWTPSEATKETSTGGEVFSYVGKWAAEEPHVFPGLKNDLGLVAKSPAAHHAISASLPEVIDNTGKTLVVQYEVKAQKGLECGGAYIKLLTDSKEGVKFKEFSDKTPYTIMFGPDKCGSTNKVHFIFRHKNPKTGEYEEKHLQSAPMAKVGPMTNLYTLIVKPDQTYEIKINNESMSSGSLLENFQPPVNPPKEIDDPNDKKPADWVDVDKIPDPKATKPDDWDEDAPARIVDENAVKPDDWLEDEQAEIPDPEAVKPDDWDDEEDGDWVAPTIANPKCANNGCGPWTRPMIANPAYKGKWSAPMIDNPAYKGVWAPRKIANPDFFEDLTPSNFEKIGAVGFEIWTMQDDILFDNIYVGHSVEDAEQLAAETWEIKSKSEKKQDEAANPVPKPLEPLSFKEDPIRFITTQLQEFIELAREDPLNAIHSRPVVTAAIAGVVGITFGLVLIVLGLLSAAPTVAASATAKAKKTDAVTPDDAKLDQDDDAEFKEENEDNIRQRKTTKKDE
ncbi:hypothetical protein BGZ73_003376 [Actinomortierella ambigua]|nr:hypothetical protein BGZ73_003376 [Actinomortierella ambigua]